MSTHKTTKAPSLEKRLEYYIDSPTFTQAETIQKYKSTIRLRPACIWVKPCYLQSAAAALRSKVIQTGTIIGRMDGATHSQIKVAEAKRALTEGASRLAAAANLGFVKEKNLKDLHADLHAISGIAHMNGAVFEMILLPEFLRPAEMITAAKVAQQAEVDLVSFPVEKTEQNWNLGLLELLRETLGQSLQFKGIIETLTLDECSQLLQTGLDSLGIKQLTE